MLHSCFLCICSVFASLLGLDSKGRCWSGKRCGVVTDSREKEERSKTNLYSERRWRESQWICLFNSNPTVLTVKGASPLNWDPICFFYVWPTDLKSCFGFILVATWGYSSSHSENGWCVKQRHGFSSSLSSWFPPSEAKSVIQYQRRWRKVLLSVM